MSTTFSQGIGTETAAYGGLVDAIGGLATVVLAIVGLAGVREDILAPIAVIVFGAALLIQGGAMVSDYAQISLPVGVSADQFGVGGLSALFLVGAAGIVLGVLALVGIAAMTLTSAAVIAFGGALLLSSNSVRQLYTLRSAVMRTQGASSFVAGEMASGSAGVQLLAGLTAIILGILAITGIYPATLVMSALIVLGATIVLSGSTLSGIVLGFMPSSEPETRARVLP